MPSGNFAGSEVKDGVLHLKYFFADDSIARKIRDPKTGEWNGQETIMDFQLTPEAVATADHAANGLPFSILPTKELSIFGDYHPWDPKKGATWEDHVAFARRYGPGEIVAITRNSNLISGAVEDIKRHNGRFAVVKITNPEANKFFQEHPEFIPQNVSPGFMNNSPGSQKMNDIRWAHLAAVPMGAYGSKAALYGSCIGDDGCVNQLVAGAVSRLSDQVTYCPVGASIMLTSLLQNSENNSQMEGSNQTASTPPPAATGTPATNTGAPITPEVKKPGVLRLKTAMQAQPDPNANTNAAVDPNLQNPQNTQNPNPANTELEDVKAQVNQLRMNEEQRVRREQIAKQIPKELFIMKGKFDQKGFEAEVEKRLVSGWDDATIAEFYTGKMELLKFGVAMQPQENQNLLGTPETPSTPAAPTGGSASGYKSPSDVPELVGASSQTISDQCKSLLSRFIGVNK